MARKLLTLRGHSVTGLSPATIITRALHTTSDFPLIVGDTIGRTLRAAYQAAPAGVRRLGRQTTGRDFRTVNKIMLGEAPTLEKLDEHGEIRAGTMAEAQEAYKVETFARKIGVTRQVLVNDDLGAFADLARRLGQAAAETEAGVLVDLLEGASGNGPTMSDGKALFHTDHSNKAASGGIIADDTLSAARLAMRSQTGLSGQRISATPKFLLVPPAQETIAEKWLASIAAAKATDVNPFSGSLSMVVEPRLSSATRWYVSADPAEIDGLEYAYLAGGEGPANRDQGRLGCRWRRNPRHPRLRRRLHRLARLVRQRRRVMADISDLEAMREALLAARSAGVRTVEYEGRRITYATDAEMAAALADLDRRIGAASAPRVSQVRISSSKGT
jgi:hypothetical protein